MKPKKLDGNGDVPQFELNKRLTHAKTQVANEQAHMIRTREKTARMQLAKAREDLIDKDLVTKQAAFLFVAMRQKMLSAPLTYHRKLLACRDPHSMIKGITEMMHTMLAELQDMPKRITVAHITRDRRTELITFFWTILDTRNCFLEFLVVLQRGVKPFAEF